jgi:hypothetical protein
MTIDKLSYLNIRFFKYIVVVAVLAPVITSNYFDYIGQYLDYTTRVRLEGSFYFAHKSIRVRTYRKRRRQQTDGHFDLFRSLFSLRSMLDSGLTFFLGLFFSRYFSDY